MPQPDPLTDFTTFEFAHAGETRTVYRKGRGPAVVVMHEIPGLTPTVSGFCRIVADAGFTVFAPLMFGTPGKPASFVYALGQMARACISREFAVLRRNGSSPITDWMRALARHAHGEVGGKGVGAVGMCLTGNFALALVVEPCLKAPVLSQPSLPFPVSDSHRRALHISSAALATLKRRAVEEGLCVLGMRFTRDGTSPPERFETLHRELGEAFEGIEIPSDSVPRSHRAWSAITGPHCVLTEDLIDEEGHPTVAARDRVIAFLRERLAG
ncbi:MAG: dienelactone hydrolase family protein [Myxococcota bacterium]